MDWGSRHTGTCQAREWWPPRRWGGDNECSIGRPSPQGLNGIVSLVATQAQPHLIDDDVPDALRGDKAAAGAAQPAPGAEHDAQAGDVREALLDRRARPRQRGAQRRASAGALLAGSGHSIV